MPLCDFDLSLGAALVGGAHVEKIPSIETRQNLRHSTKSGYEQRFFLRQSTHFKIHCQLSSITKRRFHLKISFKSQQISKKILLIIRWIVSIRRKVQI